MYVADRDTYNDVFCIECGNIADKETLSDFGLCEDCDMNTAHITYYANLVLETLGMDTLAVAFWDGLWKGIGDISIIPDWYVEASRKQREMQERKRERERQFLATTVIGT